MVKVMPAVDKPLTVTTTGPVVARFGTGTTIVFVDQLVGWERIPLNLTLLLPTPLAKPLPVRVTGTLTQPEVGEIDVRTGGSVNVLPWLATPFTVTTTGPVEPAIGAGTVMLVSLHAVGVPAAPLKVTVLLPCRSPKPEPATVTTVPTEPVDGIKLVMLGVARTVKYTGLLATPLAEVFTTTGPVVTPERLPG